MPTIELDKVMSMLVKISQSTLILSIGIAYENALHIIIKFWLFSNNPEKVHLNFCWYFLGFYGRDNLGSSALFSLTYFVFFLHIVLKYTIIFIISTILKMQFSAIKSTHIIL